MSQIVTLYSDKEKTDALYPRTKVSAISDDNNTPLKELMTGMVKQEEGGTEEEVVTPVNADTLGGKLTANNVVFYEEEMVDEFGQVVVKNADKLENHPASYFATSEELNNIITNGTLKMDLLWTNASPTSEFGEQTINLDLSKYKMVAIDYYNNGNPSKCEVYEKGITSQVVNVGYDDTNKVFNFYRTLNIGDSYIKFWVCYLATNSYANVAPSGLVPNKIYGVR